MINKYLKKINDYISEQKLVNLDNFLNADGEIAKWSDWYWSPKGGEHSTTIAFYFIDPSIKHPRKTKKYSGEQLLQTLAADLAKSYTLDLILEKGVKPYHRAAVMAARTLLSYCNGKIWALTQRDLDSFIATLSVSMSANLVPFMKYCHENNFLPKSIRMPPVKYDESAETAMDKLESKMPEEHVILVCGNIFDKIVPKIINGVGYNDNVRDCFVSCMTAIALSSPDRLAAEQITLSKQTLKSKCISVPNKENLKQNVEETVYWLDWCGSKGYKDNRNHILSSMSGFVERATNYLNYVCEPARALARFYENPNLPLEKVLGDLKVDNEHELDMSSPTSLFAIGGLLGFYDANTIKKLGIKGFPLYANQETKVKLTVKKAELIFGVKISNKKEHPYLFKSQSMTLREIQSAWIQHLTSEIMHFPYRLGGTENKVKLCNAMCIFTGSQLKSSNSSPSYKLGSSYFAIESIDLGRVVSADLSPPRTNQPSFFERNGFQRNFRITPNQFRHYINTLAQKSDLSEEIIAMWSGRKNAAQNAVYDHTSDEEKIARIAEIKSGEKLKPIKVITLEEFKSATGKSATVMPTGVCTQQLHQNPCTFLNDFVTQCAGCRSSCHINRDLDSVKILEQDLEVQRRRLSSVENTESLKSNPILQQWFLTHHRNTFILEKLIELMKSHDIKKGSLIRYADDSSSFHLIDLENRERTELKIALPDSQKALLELISDTGESDETNNELNNLLESFGVSK